jgi:hypothetical protein
MIRQPRFFSFKPAFYTVILPRNQFFINSRTSRFGLQSKGISAEISQWLSLAFRNKKPVTKSTKWVGLILLQRPSV